MITFAFDFILLFFAFKLGESMQSKNSMSDWACDAAAWRTLD